MQGRYFVFHFIPMQISSVARSCMSSYRQYPSTFHSRVIWMLLPGPIRFDVSHAQQFCLRLPSCCHSITVATGCDTISSSRSTSPRSPSWFAATTKTNDAIIMESTQALTRRQPRKARKGNNPSLKPPVVLFIPPLHPPSHCKYYWSVFSFYSVKRRCCLFDTHPVCLLSCLAFPPPSGPSSVQSNQHQPNSGLKLRYPISHPTTSPSPTRFIRIVSIMEK